MEKSPCILAIDQGTTSSRSMIFAVDSTVIAVAQQEFAQHYPQDGWVEHDPEDIWQTTLATARQAVAEAEAKGFYVASAGITNQRETTVVWDRASGEPIYNAIVWQDRRTAAECAALKQQGAEAVVQQRTGLLVDPYFSASKISWILDNVDGARAKAERGELAFGTIDCFLIHRLTGGKSHLTDASNASRTSLYNIHSGEWDDELLTLFNVPSAILPTVLNCVDDFGGIDASLLASAGDDIAIRGVAGDQQAAAIGQCCFEPGEIKSTYGTGCFVLMNTGTQAVQSTNRLLTTVAYQLNGVRHYAIEGSIFIAGAAVQWLRDGLGIIDSAQQCQAMASSLDSNHGVYLVPAFTGLGAPWWDPDVRGAMFGLTRATGPEHFVRATLESVAYQTVDLFNAMAADGISPALLRVDGGMVANDWFIQFLADVLDITVQRPKLLETTALGAAYLAGIGAGLYTGFDQIKHNWQADSEFVASMPASQRQSLLADWHTAVNRLTHSPQP
jgi:glycerol kinase